MVLGRKTNFFLGKHLLGDYAAKVQTEGYLVFPTKKLVFLPKTVVSLVFSEGKIVLSAQNHLFPRNKLVFLPKTIFS